MHDASTSSWSYGCQSDRTPEWNVTFLNINIFNLLQYLPRCVETKQHTIIVVDIECHAHPHLNNNCQWPRRLCSQPEGSPVAASAQWRHTLRHCELSPFDKSKDKTPITTDPSDPESENNQLRITKFIGSWLAQTRKNVPMSKPS